MNSIGHLKKKRFLVVVSSALALVACLSRVGHTDFLPVYGGPTYSPATGGYFAYGPAFPPSGYVNNAGMAAAPVAWANSEGLDTRAVRWSATSPPTELGGDPNSTDVTGINSTGTVIGSAFGPAQWNASSTVATRMDVFDEGPVLFWPWPLDINDAGTAVGAGLKVALPSQVNLGTRAGRWDAGGTLTELGHLGTNPDGITGARANAINAAGAAAGYAIKYYADGSSFLRAVRWNASAVAATELQAPATAPDHGYYTTVAKAINDAGIVVGNGEFNRYPAIRWDAAGNATELGEIASIPGGYISDSPKALNNAGTAVGRTNLSLALGTRAVRWDGSSTAATELGHLGTYIDGFTQAYAMAINEAGTAVGRALVDGLWPYHAVYWAVDDTRAMDLNTLIDPTSGWMLEQALDISDTGWIVGVGQFDPDGLGGEGAYPRHFLMQVPTTGVPTMPGDFNGDQQLSAADIDELIRQSASATNPAVYDLNTDLLVNVDDVNVWIRDLFQSWIGDADLNGQFNSSDLVQVLASGTFEADVDSVWSTGDFDGNGRTKSADLVAALADGGYEQGPRTAVSAVPEPASFVMLMVGLMGIAIRRRYVSA